MCYSEDELKLGNYASIFYSCTRSVTENIDVPEVAPAIEKLRTETFKALRLLENEIISLSRR